MKIIYLFLSLLVSFVSLNVLPIESRAQKKFDLKPQLYKYTEITLRRKQSQIVTYDHNHLKEIATEQVAPKFPRSCRCVGTIKVSILIDSKGRVKSATTTKGNPLLRASAMQAARKWKFKPTIINGRAISPHGELVFEFTPDGQITY